MTPALLQKKLQRWKKVNENWNWTHKKKMIKSHISFLLGYLQFRLADEKNMLPHCCHSSRKNSFFFHLFGCWPEYFTEKRVDDVWKRGGKKETYGFPGVRPPSPPLSSGRHLFSFFFYIRPSARDYSPQWLWITCRGLARSPVTKSFRRITPPHRHSTTAFFLFVFFCFLLRSVWVQVGVMAKVTFVGKK